MPVLQEQSEESASSSPEEQSDTPTPSPRVHESHQQQPAALRTRNRNSFNNAWALADTTSSAENSKPPQAATTPQKTWLAGLEHRSPIAGSPTSTKELPAPSGSFLQHRRNSSRVSSYPDVPSPLTTELFLRSTFTDGSSLVSPLPPSRRSQQPEEMVNETPTKLDLHVLKVSANTKGSPYHKPKGFGHSRNITDPFVDDIKPEGQSPLPSPFLAQPSRKMEHISSFQGRSAESIAWKSSGLVATNNSNGDAAAFAPQMYQSDTQHDGFCASNTPAYSPLPTMSPLAPEFKPVMGDHHRVDLPIPPPALSCVDGQLSMSPMARAHLDSRAAARAEWIRDEAKTIAALSRLSFVAGQKFQQTRTQEDFVKWQQLVTAYEDATNLEKRQEERRNMFMPKGMRAMKTGPYSNPEDQSASYTAENEHEEGHLLGFKMACK